MIVYGGFSTSGKTVMTEAFDQAYGAGWYLEPSSRMKCSERKHNMLRHIYRNLEDFNDDS